MLIWQHQSRALQFHVSTNKAYLVANFRWRASVSVTSREWSALKSLLALASSKDWRVSLIFLIELGTCVELRRISVVLTELWWYTEYALRHCSVSIIRNVVSPKWSIWVCCEDNFSAVVNGVIWSGEVVPIFC